MLDENIGFWRLQVKSVNL